MRLISYSVEQIALDNFWLTWWLGHSNAYSVALKPYAPMRATSLNANYAQVPNQRPAVDFRDRACPSNMSCSPNSIKYYPGLSGLCPWVPKCYGLRPRQTPSLHVSPCMSLLTICNPISKVEIDGQQTKRSGRQPLTRNSLYYQTECN